MRAIITAGLLVLASAASAQSAGALRCPVVLRFDDSHARVLVGYLGGGGSTADLAAITNHPHTRTAVAKSRALGLDVTVADLERGLTDARAGRRLDPDPFRIGDLAGNVQQTAAFLERIRAEHGSITERLCQTLARFVPPDYRKEQTLVLLSAVNTTGFSWNDGRFYLVAERFGDDLPGLLDVALHESYHAIQEDLVHASVSEACLASLPATKANPLRLLRDVYAEGAASYVGDPIAAGADGKMRAFSHRRFTRGLAGIEQHADLLDFLLFRAAGDARLEYEDADRLGLTGSEILYYVGYAMARAIAEEDGPGALATYLRAPPVAFFRRYVEIAADRPDLFRFAASTNAILDALATSATEPSSIEACRRAG